jgi:hypothetical protein
VTVEQRAADGGASESELGAPLRPGVGAREPAELGSWWAEYPLHAHGGVVLDFVLICSLLIIMAPVGMDHCRRASLHLIRGIRRC